VSVGVQDVRGIVPYRKRSLRRSRGSALSKRALQMPRYLLAVVIGCIFVVPYLMALFGAFKSSTAIASGTPWSPPMHPTLANFQQIIEQDHFVRFLLNSAGTSTAFALGQVTTSVMAGYAFARLRFPLRNTLFWAFVATMTVPEIVTIIPRYLIIKDLGWVNTYQGIVAPYFLATSFGIFLVRQYMATIPEELFDAAKIDGAGMMSTLWRVAVPISKPIVATLAILTFVFAWNNFLWPLVVTNDTAHEVVTVGIAAFQSTYGTQWNLIMAGAVLSLAPLILVFVALQRYIIGSIQLSAR